MNKIFKAPVNEGGGPGRSVIGNSKQVQGLQNSSSKATVEFPLALKIDMHTITNINIIRGVPKSSMAPELSVWHRL